MKSQIQNFLDFNGKPMYFTLVDGTWWIALRPICEALDVDWINQFKRLKTDKILKDALSKQTIHVPNDRARQMTCLPEIFVYGWLFQIRSDSPALLEYKWVCYQTLYHHFHGSITRRQQILQDHYSVQHEISELEEKLSNNEDYSRLKELKKQTTRHTKTLKQLDQDLISGQLEFWTDN